MREVRQRNLEQMAAIVGHIRSLTGRNRVLLSSSNADDLVYGQAFRAVVKASPQVWC
jgi:hypothetical protein